MRSGNRSTVVYVLTVAVLSRESLAAPRCDVVSPITEEITRYIEILPLLCVVFVFVVHFLVQRMLSRQDEGVGGGRRELDLQHIPLAASNSIRKRGRLKRMNLCPLWNNPHSMIRMDVVHPSTGIRQQSTSQRFRKQ